ncbi:DUF3261 domain-containing protein [Marinobacter mangrovi]|uniref:DUF3261 domain-containing protein n=1 Tax=Marinobacter mangrovi TaxID=2803918 RepID=UPI001933EFA4|nr:DUF3261 domain-containing protein [Marinobacter mangrovi]
MRLLITGILVALLTACSAIGLRPEPPELPLLPLDGGPGPGVVKQRMTLVSAQRQLDFISVVRLQPEALSGVVLLPSGQSLLSYRFDGSGIQVTSALSSDLPVRDFVAMLQFGLWPEHTLKNYYATRKGWTFDSQSPGQRTLSWQGTPVLQKLSADGYFEIRQLQAGYVVRVENLKQ